MKRKKAFTVTLELVLLTVFCLTVGAACLAIFTDNLGGIFSNDSSYKQLFDKNFE